MNLHFLTSGMKREVLDGYAVANLRPGDDCRQKAFVIVFMKGIGNSAAPASGLLSPRIPIGHQVPDRRVWRKRGLFILSVASG
jgi:hypothetical protein